MAVAIIGYGAMFPQQGAKEPDRPNPQLVAKLDRTIQIRYRTLTKEDIQKSRFGNSRYASLTPPHGWVFQAGDSEERRAVIRLRNSGWSTSLYVVGDDGSETTFTGPIKADKDETPVTADHGRIRTLALRSMYFQRAMKETSGGVVLEARPVLASQKKCISCHQPKKMGEPIAAVIYAFSRTPAP